jgi:hypothetical protein
VCGRRTNACLRRYRDAAPGQDRHHATADNGIDPATMTCGLVPLRPRRSRRLLGSSRERGRPRTRARRGMVESVYRRAEAAAARAIANGSQHKAMRAISQRIVFPAHRFSGRPASDTGRGRRALRPPGMPPCAQPCPLQEQRLSATSETANPEAIACRRSAVLQNRLNHLAADTRR